MNKPLLIIALIAALCLPAHAGVAVGQVLPDFELRDADGTKRQLAEFTGRWIVLEWFDPSSPFVQKFYEPGHMQLWQRDLAAQNIVWLTIYSANPKVRGYQNEKALRKVRESWKMASTAILIDDDGEYAAQVGARTTPHMYVVNPQGMVAYAGAIDDKASTASEDVFLARNYMLNAIDSLRRGREVYPASTQPYGTQLTVGQEQPVAAAK